MATESIISELGDKLVELGATREEMAAKGEAADVQLQEIQRVLAEIQQTKVQAESQKRALQAASQVVEAAADSYQKSLEPVQQAIRPGSELAEQVDDNMKRIRKALNLDSGELEELMRTVKTHDDDEVIQREEAHLELKQARSDLAQAQEKFNANKKSLEETRRKILSLGQELDETTNAALEDLEKIKDALDRGEEFKPVVHLYDLRRCHEDLEDEISRGGFGAKEMSVATAVKEFWNSVKRNYEDSARDLLEVQKRLFDKRTDLAKIEAEAKRLQIVRVREAIEKVRTKYNELKGIKVKKEEQETEEPPNNTSNQSNVS